MKSSFSRIWLAVGLGLILTIVVNSFPGAVQAIGHGMSIKDRGHFSLDFDVSAPVKSPSISGVSATVFFWRPISLTGGPSGRFTYGLAYDEQRGRTVLLGGVDASNNRLDEMWEWNGSEWIEYLSIPLPSARFDHALAYDSDRQRTVLYGGFDGGWPVDTWEWNGISWTRVLTEGVGGRTGGKLAYDSFNHKTLLFGGYSNRFMSDTWQYDGNTWIQRSPVIAPASRAHAGMAYDAHRQRVVLFGGSNDSGNLSDTWEWDGNQWIQKFSEVTPPARRRMGMAYDYTREKVLLFGGEGNHGILSDTWEWDGISWQPLVPLMAPPARYYHSLAYDSRHSLLLFGGHGSGNMVYSDTWEYCFVEMSITPGTLKVLPGQTAMYSLTIVGAAFPLSLTVEGLPLGVNAQFSSTTVVTPPVSSLLELDLQGDVPVGLYPFTVRAGNEMVTVTIPLTLLIESPTLEIIPVDGVWTVFPNTTVSYSVLLAMTPSLTTPITMTWSEIPQGMSVGFTPNPIGSNSMGWLTLDVAPSVISGDYEISLRGDAVVSTENALLPVTKAVSMTVRVLPPALSVLITPALHTVYQNQSTVYTIAAMASPGVTPPVRLRVEGLPEVAYSLQPTITSLDQTAFLFITTTLGTVTGTHPFTVWAETDGLTGTGPATLTIFPAHLTMQITPGLRSVYQNRVTTYTIEVSTTPGLTLPIAFQVGALPPGTLYSLIASETLTTQPVLLWVTTTKDTPVGLYSLTITGTLDSLQQTTQAQLIVRSAVYLPLVFRRWPPLPYPPVLATITNAGSGNYPLIWSETPRWADRYYVQESRDSGFTANVAEVCNTTDSSCEITNKLAGIYYYRVRGYNQWGYGSWSNVQAVNVLAPDSPGIYPIDNGDGNGSFSVIWNASARATHYILQESRTAAFEAPVTVYSGDQTLMHFSQKLAGTYYYRVMATGPTGNSNWSVAQSTVVLSPGVPYLNPIDNADGDGYYTVSWNATFSANAYLLQEATNAAFSNPRTIYNGGEQSWSITNQPYGTYYYRVIAVGETGASSPSNIQTAHVPAPPAGVSVLNNHTTYAVGTYRYVVGEVYNNSNAYLRFVKVAVNFYNNGQLVATDYSYIQLDNLHPYEKTCFSILLDNPAVWTHYTFEAVSYWSDGSGRPNLVSTTHNGSVYGTSYYRIIGQIRNDEPNTIRFVTALATLYNAAGKVVACDYSYVNSTDLTPGQISSFQILAGPMDPTIVTSYNLQVDGSR